MIVSPVCQIESAFLIYDWKNVMGAHRTNVKMDGYENFSNILHIV